MTHKTLINLKAWREAAARVVAVKEAQAEFARKVAASAAAHQQVVNAALSAGQPPPPGPEIVWTAQTAAFFEKELADAEYARHRALLDHGPTLLEQAETREGQLLDDVRARLGDLSPLVAEIRDLLQLKSQVVRAINDDGGGVKRYGGPLAHTGNVDSLELIMRAMANSSFLNARPGDPRFAERVSVPLAAS